MSVQNASNERRRLVASRDRQARASLTRFRPRRVGERQEHDAE